MKIHVLTDNHATRDYTAEWGLSLYIQHSDWSLLFDFGSTDLFLKNSKKLELDVLKADHFVLSHGHWDHGDGLKYLPPVKLVCHPGVFTKRYRGKKYLGLPFDQAEAEKRFTLKLSSQPLELSKDLFFLGSIPRIVEFESKKSEQKKADGSPDFMEDDSGLAIKTEKGVVVITGCAHAGVCNTVEYAKKVTGTEKVYAVLGGFHLKGRDELTEKTIAYLKGLNIEMIRTSHCTEFPALVQFANAFGSEPFASGQVLEL